MACGAAQVSMRIQILHFMEPHWFQCGSGSSILCQGFWWPKIKKSTQVKKLQFIDPSASVKDVQATGEAFSPQKKNTQHFKTWNFLTSFFFCVCMIFALLNQDPADQNRCGSMRIRIHNTCYLTYFLLLSAFTLPVHRNNLCPGEQWPSRDFHSLLWLCKNKILGWIVIVGCPFLLFFLHFFLFLLNPFFSGFYSVCKSERKQRILRR